MKLREAFADPAKLDVSAVKLSEEWIRAYSEDRWGV